jgi:hypothetical protein
MSDELSLAQKLEMVRTALPKGLTAGDSGLGGLNSKPQQQSVPWPQFTSSTSESKIYTTTPTTSQVVQPQSNAAQISTPHPWQVLLRTEDDVDQYKVDFNSTLYRGLDSFDNIAVTGLDFWAEANLGYLYLFGVVSNGVCTEASIQGPTEIPSDRIEFIDGEQNTFSVLIAYLYEDEDGNTAVQQRAFQDLTLMDFCINGNATIYPLPS